MPAVNSTNFSPRENSTLCQTYEPDDQISLFEEQIRRDHHDLEFYLEQGTESYAESLSYFPVRPEFKIGPEAYLEHISQAKAAVDIPIIASLNGSTFGGWLAYA